MTRETRSQACGILHSGSLATGSTLRILFVAIWGGILIWSNLLLSKITSVDIQSLVCDLPMVGFLAYNTWQNISHVLDLDRPRSYRIWALLALVWNGVQILWYYYHMTEKLWCLLREILIFYRVWPFNRFTSSLDYHSLIEQSQVLYRDKSFRETLHIRSQHIGTMFREEKSGVKKCPSFPHPEFVDKFNGVIALEESEWIDVGGATTFHDLVNYLLPRGLTVPVVPGFTTITVAGAISGIGIDSSSFKWGMPHNAVLEVDLLTPSGEVLRRVGPTSQDPELRALWYALPNSYGSLGYILRVRMRVIKAKPWVKVNIWKMRSLEETLQRIEVLKTMNIQIDFCEAVILSDNEVKGKDEAGRNQIYLLEGKFESDCQGPTPGQGRGQGHVVSYPRDGALYQEIPKTPHCRYMTTYDYYWRWDGDMFWGLPNIHTWIRRFTGRCFLNSRFLRRLQQVYKELMSDIGVLDRPDNRRIVQDLGIPMELNRVQKFLDQVERGTGIMPIWICPFYASEDADLYILWPLHRPSRMYLDIGIFGRVDDEHAGLTPADHGNGNGNNCNFTRELEQILFKLGGTKCFYSDNYLDSETFDDHFNGREWDRLKLRWDPERVLKDLRKIVVDNDDSGIQ